MREIGFNRPTDAVLAVVIILIGGTLGTLGHWLFVAGAGIRSLAAGLLFGLALAFPSADGSDNDDTATPYPTPADKKMGVGNWVGIAAIGCAILVVLVIFFQATYEGTLQIYQHFVLKH